MAPDFVMEIQLRDYQILPGRLDEFVERWRSGVVPLRQHFGFTVLDAFLDRTAERFVWLLGYEGPGDFAEADARYYASPERAALRPDPAELIASTTYAFVERVISYR